MIDTLKVWFWMIVGACIIGLLFTSACAAAGIQLGGF